MTEQNYNDKTLFILQLLAVNVQPAKKHKNPTGLRQVFVHLRTNLMANPEQIKSDSLHGASGP